MAEEQSNSFRPPDLTSAPMYYANDILISLGNSEITLTFGIDLSSDSPGVHQSTKAHIVMTHDNFLRMVPFLQTRVNFLNHLYGYLSPSLFNMSRQEIENAAPLLQGEPATEKQDE